MLRMCNLVAAAILILGIWRLPSAEGRGLKVQAQACAGGSCSTAQSFAVAQVTAAQATPAAPSGQAVDALHEVNAERAKRGLRPFIHDPHLTAGAVNVAHFRATHLIRGHTANDFGGLPAGATAKAAGCGALESSWGWGSCCTFDSYTYAGAAVITGRDNRRYMQIFVR